MPEHNFEKELEHARSETGALAALGPAPGATLARRFRHNAPIIAQMMAAKLDAPQTRARRRAADSEGVAAYGATGQTIRLARRKTGSSWAA